MGIDLLALGEPLGYGLLSVLPGFII